MKEKIVQGKPGADKRWAFMEGFDIGTEGDPYLDRLRIIQTPMFAIYLHHIHRPDIDRHPHDHPWWFASLILAGYYRERVWPDKHDPDKSVVRHRMRGTFGRMGRRQAHIIEKIDGPLWTLVFAGPRRAGWGFWVEGEFVPWRDYIGSPSAETYSRTSDSPARGRMRELLASRGSVGATPRWLQESLESEGFHLTREALRLWLHGDEKLNLIQQTSFGRWKAGSAS